MKSSSDETNPFIKKRNSAEGIKEYRADVIINTTSGGTDIIKKSIRTESKQNKEKHIEDGSITPSSVYGTTHPVISANDLIIKLSEYYDLLNKDEQLTKSHTDNKNYQTVLPKLEKFKSSTIIQRTSKQEKFNKEFEKLEVYQNLINNNAKEKDCIAIHYQKDAIMVTDFNFAKDKPYVIRFGIESRNIWLENFLIRNDTLHPIEQCLLDKATLMMDRLQSANSYLSSSSKDKGYPNNVILIDIFSRKNDDVTKTFKVITLEKNKNEVETHTVALWKIKDKQLVLIDPSNEKFSNFITKIKLNDYNISSGQEREAQFYNPGKLNPGYVDHNGKFKPRDCTDIAVKIGFEIGEQQKNSVSNANIDDIKKIALDNISNVMFTEHSTLKLLDNTTFNTRPLQASDPQIRGKALKTVEAYKKFPKADFTKISTIKEMEEVVEILGELKVLGIEDFT